MAQLGKKFYLDRCEILLKVEEHDQGKRIDRFLVDELQCFSREFIRKKISKGEVCFEDLCMRPGRIKSSSKVLFKDQIKVVTYASEAEKTEYWEDRPIEKEGPEVLYEDDDLMVVNKPPYMVTHPTGRHLFHTITTYFEANCKLKLHSLHRLDKETSGVLFLAKNKKFAHKMTQIFIDRHIKKSYFFIAKSNGKFNFEENLTFTANEPFLLDDSGSKERVKVSVLSKETSHPDALSATTHFEIISKIGDYILALAYPITGRQHQIRAHAYYHGLSLLGDKIYTNDSELFSRFKDEELTAKDVETLEIPRQALHSIATYCGEFSNKVDKGVFYAPISKDLREFLEKLGVDFRKLEKAIKSKAFSRIIT